ncbi:glycerol-3-phosphate dehydrogenase/oxidase [Thermoactinospora rubra]|uniref:glycerol-3-phosphate dehydrogenase/oxidase n=1 Tax=Thermoactinospora rubra TaxID=1088767 RepID=UPI000A11F9F4|nr:glycerol-3-phosphate dehydrogenase/oxidase [Thermoactinospora rubra]
MRPVSLTARRREAALQHLAEAEIDVLVVGGGVVGAGAALDAASRGLSVALVEACDWAAGTSSRSSKLIHGGLRYLEQLDFGLVREALRERALLLTTLAPHLVRPLPFLYPLRRRVWERLYVGAGITLYDTMGGARALPRHRHLSRRAALEAAPALRPDALVGAVRFYDAQVDDARYTMMVARTAAQYGAHVITRAMATGWLRDGERVAGADVLDLESGRQITVRARRVINATGPRSEAAQDLAGERRTFSLQTSKGVHLLVPRDRIRMESALFTRTARSVLLVMPWGRHWIVGTTDTPWRDPAVEPTADEADIDYLLEQANAVLREPLTRDDVEGVYAGLRPLLSGAGDDTARLSREHLVTEPAPGLVVVTGGKFTTYRVMARDAVDVAARGLPSVPPSDTARLPILGATGYGALWEDRRRVAARCGLPLDHVERLLGRYGSCVEELLDLVAADRALGEPIPGAPAHLRVEAVYAASHEGALHLDDILARRTRIAIEERDGGLGAAPHVAALVAPILGWNAADVAEEVERYAEFVGRERGDASPRAAGDATATR